MRSAQIRGGILAVMVLGALLVTGVVPGVVTGGHNDASCGFPVTLTDATGTEVTLTEEPTEVVTLAPSAAQTVWAMNASDKVVGVSMHAGFLPGAGERTNVSADPLSIDIETVVDLEPDLVLAPNVTMPGEIEDLRRLDVPVYHAPVATDLEDVMNKTERYGHLLGECESASETVASMADRIQRIEEAAPSPDDRPLAFFAMGDGFTFGEGTFQHIALETAGLENLGAEAGVGQWGQVNEEVILDEDPEWFVYTDDYPEPPISEALEQTTAWEEGNVIQVDANAISQPAPMIVDAIQSIHEAVYGSLSTPTPTPTTTVTPTQTPSDPTPSPTASPTPTGSDGNDAIPGLTVFGALAAIAVSAGLLRRRR